jgi:hypothetical protein
VTIKPFHGLPHRFLVEVLDEQPMRQYSDANTVSGQAAQCSSSSWDGCEVTKKVTLGNRKAVQLVIPSGIL